MRGGNRRGGKFTADRPLPRVSALYFDFFLTFGIDTIQAGATFKRGRCRRPGGSVTILARMNREYNKQYSHELGRDMESLVFGHAGQPIVVFPTSRGRFFEYEDAGMIGALAGKLDG